MVKLELIAERTDFTSDEEIAVRVRIENGEDTAIDIPDPNKATSTQPIYRLQGPTDEEPQTFNRASVKYRTSVDSLPVDMPPAKLLSLPPGESWSNLVALDRFTSLSDTGEYRLRARLDWQGVQAQSEEVHFRIHPLKIESIHLGLGVRPYERAEGGGAFIHQGADSSQLYVFGFHIGEPYLSEALDHKPIFRMSVGPRATDVAVPWRNSPFFDEIFRWVVWREESNVLALSSAGESPDICSLPSKSCYIVRPPLKTTGGPLDVFVVAPEQNELLLVRFEGVRTDEDESPGAVVWKTKLPQTPYEITAALGPVEKGSRRHVAFVSEHDDGFTVYHAAFAADAPPTHFDSLDVPGQRLITGLPPAVFVQADGNAIVSILGLTRTHPVTCSYIETVFSADGPPKRQQGVADMGYLPVEPSGAALILADSAGMVKRRDAVLNLGDDGLYKMGPMGGLEPLSVQGTPTQPILLAPGQSTSYILYADPMHGLRMEPL